MKKLCAAFLVLLLVVCAVWLVACDCKHEYADWLVTTAPTCDKDGVRTRHCRKCDREETETVPAGHTLTPVAGVSASCEEEGVIEHDRCTACNKLFIDGVEKTAEELVIPKTEHVLLAVNAAPASCHEDGVLAHLRCEYCGINYLRGEVIADADLVIPATHETVDIPGIEKTCTTDGRLAYIFCYDCGACFIGEQEVTEEELCIPAGHDLTDIREVAATCEEDGVLAHGHCVTCGADVIDGAEKTEDELRIPATGHEYGSLIEETGKRKHYHCDTCGSDFDEGYREITKLDMTSHVFGEWHEGTPATCTTPGRRGYYQCTLDPACTGFYYDVNYDYIGSTEDCLVIPAGHHYETRYDKEKHMSVCTRCGDVEYTYSHSLMDDDAYENVYEVIGDHVYWHCKCAGCGYAAAEDCGPALTDLFVERSYIIDVDSPATFLIGYRLTTGEEGGSSLNQYRITPDFYDALYAIKARPASDFPIKQTFTVSALGFTREIEITFDIERISAVTEYPVYTKGSIETIDDIEIVLVDNNGNVYDRISLSDCENVDNGGFDVDADLTKGDKRYTLKFTYDGKPFECSFVYTAEEVPFALVGNRTDVVSGGVPILTVYYTTSDGRWPETKRVPLFAFTIEEGTFDIDALGEYTLTVSLGDYLRGTVTITVMDPKTVVNVTDDFVFPAGSPFMRVRVRYLDGTSGYEVITSRMVLDADYDEDGVALDLNSVGQYGIIYVLRGELQYADVTVYNPQDLRAVDMNPCGNTPLIWEYETATDEGNAKYTLRPDLTGLFFRVRLDDGTEQTIQVTEDMISFDADALAKAVAQGSSSSFYVTVTYRGYTYQNLRVIPALRLPHQIVDLMSDGEWENTILVRDGALCKDYMLIARDAVYGGYYHIPLTLSMLYQFTEREDGTVTVGDAPIDPAKTGKGYYRVVVRCEDAQRDFNLCIFDEEDVVRELSAYTVDFSYAICGDREAILEGLREMRFDYYELVKFGKKRSVLTREEVTFEQMTLGDTSAVDFTQPGEAELKLSYKGAEYTLRFDLIPHLDLYAFKSYVTDHRGETLVVRLYENGYYRFINTYDSSVGQYETVDAHHGVIRLGIGGDLYLPDENGIRLDRWTGSLFGEKYGLTPTVYTLNDTRLYVYTHDGISYADAYGYDDYYEEWSYESTYVTEIGADGSVALDGMKFSVGEGNVLSIIVEGNRQYAYSETGEDIRVDISFNDNGNAYITETALNPETGEEHGTFRLCYQWTMEGDVISLIYGRYTLMTFKVKDGVLTPEQTIL